MVPNELILNMFDTLHTKCLIKCVNDNFIDYLVSLGYENYIEWCLGYDGNVAHKLYWNDDYIEWF